MSYGLTWLLAPQCLRYPKSTYMSKEQKKYIYAKGNVKVRLGKNELHDLCVVKKKKN